MHCIWTKIRRSLAIRGNIGTIKLFGTKIISLCKGIMPSYRAVADRVRELDKEFDRKYGVETSGIVDPRETAVKGDNWIYGLKYQPVSPTSFVQIIKELSIPYDKFVFIDFGSGKGRVLLLASEFPFKKIVGIEYCADFNRIAQQNLSSCSKLIKRCEDIEILLMDAAEYHLPNEPLVLFFYNPFGRPVMEKVVKNVIDSFELNPRRMIIIYITPEYADLWDNVGFLKRCSSDRAIWDTRSIILNS